MENHKASSSKKASPGWCKPKKIKDQRTFRTSWIQKIAMIFAFFQSPLQNLFVQGFQVFPSLVNKAFLTCQFFFQTMNNDMPMRIKSIVQTGPKTHEGGFKAGLVKVEYQEAIAGIVKSDPIHPAICGIISEIISFNQFDLFMEKV